jgi:hypothetical protein
MIDFDKNKARNSTNAIKRLYISMQYLISRGFYKPMGRSGEGLRSALLELSPEIYGSIADQKNEIDGLKYILDRLPEGIHQCTHINLTSDEGFSNTHYKVIIPAKRRRNCYRIDPEQMNIEITRGRSDIYDILTHLTFLYIEADKLLKRIYTSDSKSLNRDWIKIEAAVSKKKLNQMELENTLIHLASLMGRTYTELEEAHRHFATKSQPHKFIEIIYGMGKLALDEKMNSNSRIIRFSPLLRERLGHHIYGEKWANNIKDLLNKKKLIKRPIHLISANMHSVMNALFAQKALQKEFGSKPSLAIYQELSEPSNEALRTKVMNYAQKNGMVYLKDSSGTNIDVQLFDMAYCNEDACSFYSPKELEMAPVLMVMDYAFGEQAFETIDEFLKPIQIDNKEQYINMQSISIMGKAGILEGKKGDLMIPNAHIFEGTADNYPFENSLKASDFSDSDLGVQEGTMISVLGTSLQNRDLLSYFKNSSWNVVGLEMEGVHYQKAIQAASKIRGNIKKDIVVRYAYYASDNPLETGSTLASGGLGNTGVKPTYAITEKILEQIFKEN